LIEGLGEGAAVDRVANGVGEVLVKTPVT